MMLGRLDLSDAQKEQVRTIVESHRDELRELGERGMHARQALEAAVMANVFDEAAIRAAAAEVGVVEADMAVARARISAEVHQVLTAEQQAKLEQLRAQMRERMESRRQRRQASL
jgi:protein CpxP